MIERALIAGLGSIGKRHLRLLRYRMPKVQIMALRHRDSDELIDGLDEITTSIDEAIAFAPQIAVIATPAPFHTELAISLAAAGAHLLVEKPMATALDDASKLVEIAQEMSIVLQVGYNLRFAESLNVFRTTLNDGLIGRVATVRAEVGQYLPDWRPGSDWRNTVSARPELGGGALFELSHEIDYLRWIFGNVTGIRAWTGRQGDLRVKVEDTAHLVLEFAETLPQSAAGVPPVATLSLDFIRRDTVRRCVAIGTDATLEWDGIASEVRLTGPHEPEVLLHSSRPGRDATYLAQLDAFLANVENRSLANSHAANAEDGLSVTRIIESVHKSHFADGAKVTLGK